MSDLVGKRLGQYEIVSVLGKGGMAVVYKARQPSMDRDVAVKVIGGQLVDNPDFVSRFEREARLIAKLQHPHILPVYDFGNQDGQLFLVMRLVEGGSLDQRLRHGALSPEETLRMLTQIGSALDYAHDQGVIHRDMKPNNILLDSKNNPYLTDFGIARMMDDSNAGRLTATGVTVGTPSYMAPEQWRGENIDGRADIYGLGIMTYEMLTGDLPFKGETAFALMYKHFDAPPPHISRPDVPDTANAVLEKAMAKRREDRYASGEQMARAFAAVLSGTPTAAGAAAGPEDSVATFVGTVDEATGVQRTPTRAGRATAALDSAAAAPVQDVFPVWARVVGGVALAILLVGIGILVTIQNANNVNATATRIAELAAVNTQVAALQAAQTATAKVPTATNPPTATLTSTPTATATITSTVALPTPVRFTDYSDQTYNIRFRYPDGWEVQKKEGFGVFITQSFKDLDFTGDVVNGPAYIQFAVADSKGLGALEMAKAKTASDAMVAFLGREQIRNLDLVFGTRFETATTTRNRAEIGKVRTNYLMVLGPDRFAIVLVQASPEQIEDINRAIALPLIRSIDFLNTPTKAVVVADTATPTPAFTFTPPTEFVEYTSQIYSYSMNYPKGWQVFDSGNNLLLSSQSGVKIDDPNAPPYIAFFVIKQKDLRNYQPEKSIEDLHRDNLGALADNSRELRGMPYPTAVGRATGNSTFKLNGWVGLVKLHDDLYLQVFAQAPRGSEDQYLETVLTPLFKSLHYTGK